LTNQPDRSFGIRGIVVECKPKSTPQAKILSVRAFAFAVVLCFFSAADVTTVNATAAIRVERRLGANNFVQLTVGISVPREAGSNTAIGKERIVAAMSSHV
jgi:hypothetical protein